MILCFMKYTQFELCKEKCELLYANIVAIGRLYANCFNAGRVHLKLMPDCKN